MVRLTAAGEVLLAQARDVLDRWDLGMAAVNEAAVQARRVLVVGIQTSVGRDLQRRTLAGFAERQPEWRLSLRLCPWDDPAAGLTEGTSDVAFVWLPTPDDSELVTAVLYREPRWVALPDDHRFAEQVTVPWPTCSTRASSRCLRPPGTSASSGWPPISARRIVRLASSPRRPTPKRRSS